VLEREGKEDEHSAERYSVGTVTQSQRSAVASSSSTLLVESNRRAAEKVLRTVPAEFLAIYLLNSANSLRLIHIGPQTSTLRRHLTSRLSTTFDAWYGMVVAADELVDKEPDFYNTLQSQERKISEEVERYEANKLLNTSRALYGTAPRMTHVLPWFWSWCWSSATFSSWSVALTSLLSGRAHRTCRKR
jgi:hypothetical protein